MKVYTSLDIPLWNWLKIQDSQNDGEIELKYLVKGINYDKPPKRLRRLDLYSAYLNILYQIPEMDIGLTNAWTLYILELKKYEVSIELTLWEKLAKRKSDKVEVNKLNVSFAKYLDELDQSYTEFEFTKYGLIKDFEKQWNYEIEIPTILIKNKDLEFFRTEEYINQITEWFKDGKLTLEMSLLMMSKEFYEKFIESRELKTDSVRKIHNIIYNRFRDMGQSDKWRLIRTDFFNLYKLKFVPQSESNMMQHIISLRKVNEQPIPLKETTLKEYFDQVEVAKRSQEQKKPNGK